MNTVKRSFAFLICLVMFVSAFGLPVSALETENGLVYIVNGSSKVEITGYNGSAASVVIPSSVSGKQVLRINTDAFTQSEKRDFTVTVPDSVTAISEEAFGNIGKLTVICNENSFAQYYAYTQKYLTRLWSYAPEAYPDTVSVSLNKTQAVYTVCKDVSTKDWYYECSKFASQHGFLKGYSNGNFGANDKMQRQDFAIVLSKLYCFLSDSERNYTPVFSDVTDNSQYYFEPVTYLYTKGLVSGYSNGKFGVGDSVSREQICMFLYRVASYYAIDTDIKDTKALSSFKDAPSVSASAKTAVTWCADRHIIGGSSNLEPTRAATRAEVTAFLQNFVNYCVYGKKYVAPEPEKPKTPTVTINNNSIKSNAPYYIKVNRTQNIVIIYKKDSQGHFNVPVKAMACSVGLNGKTPTGTYTTTDKYTWRLLSGNVWGQYATRITGHYLFHSVPYYTKSKSDLEYDEYNKLGQAASLGCIRLCVADAKWIYDNCPSGTVVTIYDSTKQEPLAKPTPKRINTKDSRRGWDPTDPDPKNPW